ncbi:hypothetical protein OAH49_01885 [Nitrosopumilus sp.]|nr:hypothetical protein [Nitrosopumilus sp.]
MTIYVPKFDDWKSLGMVNNNLTWLAIKPQAEVLLFRDQKHSETYYFEKCSRISFSCVENKEEIHIVPQNAIMKRVAVA